MGIKTGLLGGSFDPVHLAHIALAQAAKETLGLSGVELIPAANPWQRAPLAATAEHRLAMLDIATRHDPKLRINPLELDRGGNTYTIDTLRQLPAGPEYYWILGSDQLANFCSWHRWQDIVTLVHLAVAQRPGTAVSPPMLLEPHLAREERALFYLPFEPVSISSTQIRKRLFQGEPTDGLLDAAVAQYIHRNGLYQSPLA